MRLGEEGAELKGRVTSAATEGGEAEDDEEEVDELEGDGVITGKLSRFVESDPDCWRGDDDSASSLSMLKGWS